MTNVDELNGREIKNQSYKNEKKKNTENLDEENRIITVPAEYNHFWESLLEGAKEKEMLLIEYIASVINEQEVGQVEDNSDSISLELKIAERNAIPARHPDIEYPAIMITMDNGELPVDLKYKLIDASTTSLLRLSHIFERRHIPLNSKTGTNNLKFNGKDKYKLPQAIIKSVITDELGLSHLKEYGYRVIVEKFDDNTYMFKSYLHYELIDKELECESFVHVNRCIQIVDTIDQVKELLFEDMEKREEEIRNAIRQNQGGTKKFKKIIHRMSAQVEYKLVSPELSQRLLKNESGEFLRRQFNGMDSILTEFFKMYE